MNVREEEDRKKNTCPSRGLGLAAAAIGVGVGAALYYFFSKGPENPDGEGSTSGWTCEEPHAFNPLHGLHDDSYTTISEHSTTDTSMNDSTDTAEPSEESDSNSEAESSDHWAVDRDQSSASDNDVQSDNFHLSISSDDSFGTGNLTLPTFSVNNVSSDSDTMDWDVTSSSIGVPGDEGRSPISPLMSLFNNLGALVSPRPGLRRRTAEETQMAMLRDQALYEKEQLRKLREQFFRERSWSLEECSICFDIILKDQPVTTLPCTHHFHSACITPWLQEQQTCPNCRKAAE